VTAVRAPDVHVNLDLVLAPGALIDSGHRGYSSGTCGFSMERWAIRYVGVWGT
jgi:hypothetical protein